MGVAASSRRASRQHSEDDGTVWDSSHVTIAHVSAKPARRWTSLEPRLCASPRNLTHLHLYVGLSPSLISPFPTPRILISPTVARYPSDIPLPAWLLSQCLTKLTLMSSATLAAAAILHLVVDLDHRVVLGARTHRAAGLEVGTTIAEENVARARLWLVLRVLEVINRRTEPDAVDHNGLQRDR